MISRCAASQKRVNFSRSPAPNVSALTAARQVSAADQGDGECDELLPEIP
jgi:hypothetical protein